MNENAILFVRQTLYWELLQIVIYIAYDSMPVARPVKVVLAAKFDGGLKADTTAFLGFIEVTTWGKLSFTHCPAHKTQSQEV